jgi:hypothetical protein
MEGSGREEGERKQYPKVHTASIITLHVQPGEVTEIQDGEEREQEGRWRREKGGRRKQYPKVQAVS